MLLWQNLERWSERQAIFSGRDTITYTDLMRQADKYACILRSRLPKGISRPLILLEATNAVPAIVAYIAARRAKWPIILVADGAAGLETPIATTYAPNVVITRSADWEAVVTDASQPDLAPELAVLLSTSGTTGAAKLVRLSEANLAANAAAITAYLGVTDTDRAITALPFHYSYGMSVLHIHLLAGAALVLTEDSVVENAFWDLARRHAVTSISMVPTQYELLKAAGFSKVQLPSLRYLTQAGGRLDPDLAQSFAQQAYREGWQFFIMYGQTEAGPRISYVPPEDAAAWGHTIGRPVDGVRLNLIDQNGVPITTHNTAGELVAEGPGIMMGYATSRKALALPQGPDRLLTGDIAEQLENGYFRIVGRSNRFLKIFGLRIGLDEVETTLRGMGHPLYASGTDQGLVLFILPPASTDADLDVIRAKAAKLFKLPLTVIKVVRLESPPLLPSGKVNYRNLALQAEELLGAQQAAPQKLLELLQVTLRCGDLDLEQSFADAGGDSLSYLEVQLYLSDQIGEAPGGWERLPLRTLLALEASGRETPPPRWSRTDADQIGRVAALLMVISLHSTTWPTGGGAYLLLILSGYSIARFQSQTLFSGDIMRAWRVMLLPLVIGYYVLITGTHLLWAPINPQWFYLAGNFLETIHPRGLTPYWFVCTYLQVIVLLSLPFLFTPARTLIARSPFAFGLVALALVVVITDVLSLDEVLFSVRLRHPIMALEMFLLGWSACFARDLLRKTITGAAAVSIYLLHWSDVGPLITLMMLVGIGGILLELKIPLPTFLAKWFWRIGTMTMFLYLIHTPVISISSRLLPPDNWLQFTTVVIISLIIASSLRAGMNMIGRRIWRGQHVI